MGLAKIKNNIDNLAKSHNVANQTLWDMFFFENFLNHLSKSKYKTNFVFKGGFLLGSIVGIEQRTTLDIDLKYVGTNLDDVVLLNVFREICEVDLDDEINMVTGFSEKPVGNGGWINGGFMVMEPAVFDYLSEQEGCVLERTPLETLAKEGKLGVYKHTGFWQCMDTQRDKGALEARWNNGDAPWKVW